MLPLRAANRPGAIHCGLVTVLIDDQAQQRTKHASFALIAREPIVDDLCGWQESIAFFHRHISSKSITAMLYLDMGGRNATWSDIKTTSERHVDSRCSR